MIKSLLNRMFRSTMRISLLAVSFLALVLSLGAFDSLGFIRGIYAANFDCVTCQGTWACATNLSSCFGQLKGCSPNVSGSCQQQTLACGTVWLWTPALNSCGTFGNTRCGATYCK